MSTFQQGQKSPLADLTTADRLEVGIQLGNPGNMSIDVSCFGLDEAGKLSDDRYFVFYNQPRSPCGGLAQEKRAGYDQLFAVELKRLPSTIKRLVFTAAIDGNGTMGNLTGSKLVVLANGQPVMTFPFEGRLFGGEKALMIAEIYFKTVWRVTAVGQGFNGGLAALLEHFGGQADGPAPPPAAPAPKPAAPAPAPAAAAPKPAAAAPTPTAPVSLVKITLDKRGESQKVSLKKEGGSTIHVNLNWDTGKKSWWKAAVSADLDLGCMFQLKTGEKGVIQPLGNRFGARHEIPYILLDKDDRSGAATDGENLRIYRPDLIQRVVIFAMIYEGTANFTSVNGRVTIKDDAGNEITVHCNNPDSSLTFCAVCLIENIGSEMRYTKEERYFPSHQECDEHFGFGFRWVAGRK